MTHTYKITGMTCSGCEAKVRGLLSGVPGVKSVQVRLADGEADIEMSDHISTQAFTNVLAEYPKYQLSEPLKEKELSDFEEAEARSWMETYKPILIIFGYILTASIIAGYTGGGIDLMKAMRIFMAGFFMTFSFFKMLNLKGFADSYAMYDVIARRFKPWGYIYAFTELLLGLAFATNFEPVITNSVTLVVMSLSIIGVLQSVLNKSKIQCACLGAVFNLPMSTVTIIEDALMIGMSGIMLYYLLLW
jgi:copper chaperone CopZ